MGLFIKFTANKGRGVFSDTPIKKGETIEICPMLVLPFEDRKHIDKTLIYNYYFQWGEDNSESAIALGYGSMYNHSRSANADYISYYNEHELHIIAYKDIEANEEITINYHNEPECKEPMWFEEEEEDEEN